MHRLVSCSLAASWIAAIALAACSDDAGLVEADASGSESGDGDGDGDPGPVCGDGIVELDEVCDDGNADNSDSCLDSCELASCGDGFVRVGVEACDDGNADNSDACLDSCEVASCGDGFVWVGNEECDPADPATGEVCGEDVCIVSKLLLEDFEGGVVGWTHEAETVIDTWNISQDRARSGRHSYHSGEAQTQGLLRLISPELDLSAFAQGDDIRLEFWQWYRYDVCEGSPDFLGDGHLVEVSVAGGPYEPLTPIGGYPYVLEDYCDNPLAGRPAYSQTSADEFEQVSVDLSTYVGSTIRLAWTVGTDCDNCVVEPMLYLDDVSVTRSL